MMGQSVWHVATHNIVTDEEGYIVVAGHLDFTLHDAVLAAVQQTTSDMMNGWVIDFLATQADGRNIAQERLCAVN